MPDSENEFINAKSEKTQFRRNRHSASTPHTPWRSRGYLPHRDEIGLIQSITFRLWDALPQKMLRRWRIEQQTAPWLDDDAARRARIEAWLDQGMGSCVLRHPSCAQVVEETLLRFDGERYLLLAWCIMPNHVHVLIQSREDLGRIIQSWKSYTARWILARAGELELLAPKRRLWLPEYWDRYIRDVAHFRKTVEYIHHNPVQARLCPRPQDWPWSSARRVLKLPDASWFHTSL